MEGVMATRYATSDRVQGALKVGCPAALGVGLLLAVLLFVSGATVSEGHRGVLLTAGRASDGTLQPGFHLIMPLVQRIVQVDVRVQAHQFRQIQAASREYQAVALTGAMNYHLLADHADDIYRTVGLDFDDKVIDPAFADFIKEIVPQYAVTDILAKRDEIRQRTKESLGRNLERYGIVVDDIYLSDIQFSPEYTGAIEAKQVAQQNVEKETQVLEQKKIQAEQAETDARGQANAAIERARGESEANRKLAEGITPQLIEYLRATKWDGKLPIVSGEANPLIQLPTQR
jgi:regulator of protease activity HflC (stomatin/prohibitin superfamily)